MINFLIIIQGRKMTLEEQIKHYRKQAGLSQEKMAEV